MHTAFRALVGSSLSAAFCLFSATAAAQAAAPTTASAPPAAENFFRHADFAELRLSPDGRRLAAAVRLNGRRNLAIVDVASGATKVITNFTARDLGWFRWVNNERIVYGFTNLQAGLADEQDWGSGLFAVNVDGSAAREIYPLSGFSDRGFDRSAARGGRMIKAVSGTDDILVAAPARSTRALDVVRINTRTGQKTIVVEQRPGDVKHWVIDRNDVPRAALVDLSDEQRKFGLFLRADVQSPWQKIGECDAYTNECINPVAFEQDGSLLVTARNGADKLALYRWDAQKNALGEKLIAHADYDADSGLGLDPDAGGLLGPVFDSKTGALIGFRFQAEALTQVWFDPEVAKVQAMVDAALPGKTNVLSRPDPNSKVLVFSSSERDPGRWFLLDIAGKKMQPLVAAMPWVKPETMAEKRFIRYPARDGLSIPAYLTLPQGKDGKNLPLVVLVHGGPYVRGETNAFDPQAQFLASRGYAVLQADYRGSYGYGRKHHLAGRKQWGQAMQDDLSDGIKHLAAKGTVDPRRVCIMGGSYGGYAAMMGVAKDPDLYRCAINIVGVTDLPLMIEQTWSDTNAIPRYSQGFFDNMIGRLSDPKEKAMLEANSPARLASRIKAPVLIAHGGGDQRVPIQHATRMRSALRDAGMEPEWLYFPDEGHGFRTEAARIELYTAIERFLGKHLN